MNKGIEKATRESRMTISTNMEKNDDIIEIDGRYNGRLYRNAELVFGAGAARVGVVR